MKAKSKPNRRTSDDAPKGEFLTSEAARNTRSSNFEQLKTDPYSHEDIIEEIFGAVARGTDTARTRESAGLIICRLIRACDSKALQRTFSAIVRIKESAEANNSEEPHRNARSYKAYSGYIEAYGKEPTRAALKKFITSQPERYGKSFPDDRQGWKRLWDDSGLHGLK